MTLTIERDLLLDRTASHLDERLADDGLLCDCHFCQWLVSLPTHESLALIHEAGERVNLRSHEPPRTEAGELEQEQPASDDES